MYPSSINAFTATPIGPYGLMGPPTKFVGIRDNLKITHVVPAQEISILYNPDNRYAGYLNPGTKFSMGNQVFQVEKKPQLLFAPS